MLGGGQLGRMIALAAARLGFDVVVMGREPASPAGRVAAREIVGDYLDSEALAQLAASCDVLTFEFENVPSQTVEALEARGLRVAPCAHALAVAQDRAEEKAFLNANGCPTVAYVSVDGVEDLRAGLARLGAPALLKTRREGYDGKGQVWVGSEAEAQAAWTAIGARPAVLEARCPFVRELSIVAARGEDGSFAAYPLGENHHEHGVLRRTVAPALVTSTTAAEAERIARAVTGSLGYVGVIGIELFELEGGALLVNEIAPRVHNTGHWTTDACEVDQFEQHVRAVMGWPLGPTAPLASAEMTNLLGEEALDWAALAAEPAARLWLYGKRDAAPGRKMGHVTRLKPLSDVRHRQSTT